jgi:hypothetical protein
MANLKVNRGTTYTIEFQYQRDGVDTTLVGATVRFTVKAAEYDSNATDSDAIILKNVTDGDANGQATIVIDPADTALVAPLKYYYDIKVEQADGEIYKVDQGRLTLDGSPTNRQ